MAYVPTKQIFYNIMVFLFFFAWFFRPGAEHSLQSKCLHFMDKPLILLRVPKIIEGVTLFPDKRMKFKFSLFLCIAGKSLRYKDWEIRPNNWTIP